jgi:hypothetical protein
MDLPGDARRLFPARENELHCYSLGHYITYFSGNICHDALDRVYGLLGLTGQEVGITPDYTKSAQELYSDVIRASCIAFYKSRFGLSIELEDINIVLTTKLGCTGCQTSHDARYWTLRRET